MFVQQMKLVEDNLEFQWGGHHISLFELPEHSLESIGILIDVHTSF